MRLLPELTPFNEWFWTSGADGKLRVQGCRDCGQLVHPPVPICPACRSTDHQPTEVSGRATVVGVTVNAHPWLPGFDPPYVIAVVALAEDPSVRLTTNIVGGEPDDVGIGDVVEVRFEQDDDVWLPLFERTGEVDPVDRVPEPQRPTPRPPVSTDRFEHRSVLSGIGRSAMGRRLMRDPLSLTVDACLAAVADAGLTLDDIDGLSTYPGAGPMGMSEGGVTAVEEALRIRPTWTNGGMDMPGPGGSVIAGMLAVVRRAVPPRPLLPDGVGVDVRHPRAAAAGRPAGVRPDAGVPPPVRRHVGVELDRHERQPVPPPLRRRRGSCSGASPSTAGPTPPATPPRSTATR